MTNVLQMSDVILRINVLQMNIVNQTTNVILILVAIQHVIPLGKYRKKGGGVVILTLKNVTTSNSVEIVCRPPYGDCYPDAISNPETPGKMK